MDAAIADFSAVTGADTHVATQFLQMTDGDAQQAIQLFFDSPELGSAMANQAPSELSQPPSAPQQRHVDRGRTDSEGVVHLDSDDDVVMADDDNDSVRESARSETTGTTSNARASTTAAPASSAAFGDYEDDEAIARRMQEELYAGGDLGGDYNNDVRAPMARTTETLVGPGADWAADDMHEAVLQQLRARAQPRSRQRLGVFNQQAAGPSSIWEENDPSAHQAALNEATGGAAGTSSKAARLAELFRPPFELMTRVPWEDAREQGKDEQKWILVNVQDPSIFDCQSLNRDIWKDEGVKDTVKENFIFMQYDKDDPRGNQYIQYYFPLKDSQAAYPHIAIVDPRTGEQVKVWSGPPVPKAPDFMMQLHEFLDRYSLNAAAKNPVAKRKPEKPVAVDVDRLTEEEMLNLALQNSLANGETGPKEHDPDDLTKSIGDLTKGKGRDIEADLTDANDETLEADVPSPFSAISSTNPHTEPVNNPATTTRIQFRHSSGRIIRRFEVSDPVRRIYEWLKAEPIEGKEGMEFELKSMGKDLIEALDSTVADAGLKNGTVMVEYLEE